MCRGVVREKEEVGLAITNWKLGSTKVIGCTEPFKHSSFELQSSGSIGAVLLHDSQRGEMLTISSALRTCIGAFHRSLTPSYNGDVLGGVLMGAFGSF